MHLLTLPAFLTSAASTLNLQTQILCVASRLPLEYILWLVLATQQDDHASPPLPDQLPEKQVFGVQPGNLSALAQVELQLADSQSTAQFLAATAPHSIDWLLALTVCVCVKLQSETTQSEWQSLCTWASASALPHLLLWCLCWHSRTAWLGVQERITKHQTINEAICCTLTLAGVPSCMYMSFVDNENVIHSASGWLQDLEFFYNGIQALEKRWAKCISVGEDYVEKWQNNHVHILLLTVSS